MEYQTHKNINGYDIYKEGTWCEVSKNGNHIFYGNVESQMTFEQIYQEIKKEVVFSINGKEVLNYDALNEFEGEREATIESLAEQYKCNKKDIKISYRIPPIHAVEKEIVKSFNRKNKEVKER